MTHRPRRLPRHPRRLGAGAGRTGERDLAGRHARVRRAVGEVRPHHADRVRRGGRAAAGADGQLRGRPPQPRRGRDRPAGPPAHRQGGRGRLAGRERGDPRGAARRAAGASDRARLRRRRALLRPPPQGADRARREGGRRGPRHPRLHRRPRHRRPRAARRCSRRCRSGSTRRASAASARSSGATSRWTATRAGTAPRRPSNLLREGEAEHEAESGEAAAKAAYERDETDEFITATKVGDEDSTIRDDDSVLAFNFRPDRMRQITKALDDDGVRALTCLTEYDEDWTTRSRSRPSGPT